MEIVLRATEKRCISARLYVTQSWFLTPVGVIYLHCQQTTAHQVLHWSDFILFLLLCEQFFLKQHNWNLACDSTDIHDQCSSVSIFVCLNKLSGEFSSKKTGNKTHGLSERKHCFGFTCFKGIYYLALLHAEQLYGKKKECQCNKLCHWTTFKTSLSSSELDPKNIKQYVLTDQQKQRNLQVNLLVFCTCCFHLLFFATVLWKN